MSSDQPPTPSDHPNPPATIRKLIVEVIETRDLLPKDGQGSSSPYVVADFDGQKRRTSTVPRNLNPVWNEALDFVVSDPKTMEFEELNVEVLNDKKLSNGNGRKNHFLGRVKLYGSQLVKRGEEGLVYFTLEKKSVFSWIKGELGLKVYYYDEIMEEEEPPPPPEDQPPPPPEQPSQPEEVMKKPVFVVSEEPPRPMEPRQHSPLMVRIYEPRIHEPPPENNPPPGFSQDMRRMQMGGNGMPGPMTGERMKVLRRPGNEGYSPRIIAGKFNGDTSERIQAFDLVEPMQYLFVRIAKGRGLSPSESPNVGPYFTV